MLLGSLLETFYAALSVVASAATDGIVACIGLYGLAEDIYVRRWVHRHAPVAGDLITPKEGLLVWMEEVHGPAEAFSRLSVTDSRYVIEPGSTLFVVLGLADTAEPCMRYPGRLVMRDAQGRNVWVPEKHVSRFKLVSRARSAVG